MYSTRMKIAVVALVLSGLGGAGVTLWATQDEPQKEKPNQAFAWQPRPAPVAEPTQSEPPQASAEEEPPEVQLAEDEKRADAAKLERDMARSRLNLKKLALAMHNYADVYGHLPRAIMDKNGKALLSWRVALLPYLEQQELYRQFKLDEPWDSPHNRKFLSKMPAVYAPPGIKTRRPYSTFYQVFVSASPSAGGGMAGGAGMPGGGGASGGPMMGGAGGPGGAPGPGGAAGGAGAPGGGGQAQMMMQQMNKMMMGGAPAGGVHGTAIFVKGEVTRFPASIPDGTSNTILIIEAGNPVPWTKPEDLHYADDEPLPELGGLFPNVIHAAFADGAVHTLTKNYDEKHLRYAISANDGMNFDWSKIQVRSPRRRGTGGDRASLEAWQQKNVLLQKELAQLRQQIRLLKEEQEVERELAEEDPQMTRLKEENAVMQAELKKLRTEIESLKKGIGQPGKPRKRSIEEEDEQPRIRKQRNPRREEEELPRK